MNNIELKTSDPIYNLEVKRANVIVGSGSSVDVVWGSIVGDISQQTDLQDELNGIKEQVKEDIANKADRSELANLATKEELSSGLLGKADKENTYTKEEVDDKIAETDLSNYYTKQEIDEKGYITAETDPTVPEWAKQPTKPTYTAEEVGALSADTEIPDISGLATKEEVETKQDKLVSGTNIKTVNGNSLLGEGNIEIQDGTGGISDAPTDGKKYVRQNQSWVEETDTSSFATKSEIPTNVSQLNNDSGYLTEIPTEYITEEELTSKDYATNTSLSTKLDVATYNEDKANFATKDEIPEELPIASSNTLGGIKVGAGLSINSETGVLSATGGGTADSVDWANVTSKPDFKTVATTGSYNDLTDKPTIPTKTSELTNDSGFITSIPEEYVTETELTDKNYATVSQIPSLEGYATQTWVSEQGYLTEHQDISNLATKQEVTEGLANKLDVSTYNIDKETFETKTNAAATYQPKGDYALKSEIPDTSTLATKEELTNELDGKQDLLISGTNIKTINGQELLGEGNIEIQNEVPILQSSSEGKTNNYIYSKGSISDRSHNAISFIAPSNDTNGSISYTFWGDSGSYKCSIQTVTQARNGLMLLEDKVKLDSINAEDLLTKTEASTTYATKLEVTSGLEGKADASDTYSKSEVDSKINSAIGGVYKYKGSKSTYSELPSSGNEVGDVWNVLKNDINYAWTGSDWDPLGGTSEKASSTIDGLMSKEDKVKLDTIEQGAQVNTVTSVAGRTGAITLSKTDVGLGNVDNTSDANKPISTATQSALDNKADKSSIPTNVSQLTNDSGYITSTVADSTYINKSQITFSTSEPSGGSDGDIWFVYE